MATPGNGNQLVIGGDAKYRNLSGDEKAAVLLLSLGPDYGKPILEELDEMEIKILSRAMVRVGAVTQDMVMLIMHQQPQPLLIILLMKE